MGSSFNLYLNEGLIKLPPKLTDSILEYFVYWYLAFLEGSAEADSSLEEDDIDMIRMALERLAKKHGSKAPTPGDIKKAMTNRAIFKNFPVEDLPQQYLERVAKVRGPEAMKKLKDAHVKFVVSFRKHPKVDMDNDFPQGIFYAEPAEIIVSIPNMPVKIPDVIHLLSTFNHAEISRSINNTMGIVEHELTHAVQSMVLWLLHEKQYDPNASGKSAATLPKKEAKKDQYFTSDLEFAPFVKSSIRELKSIFEKNKATTEAAKKELFIKYTYSDVAEKAVNKANDKKFARSSFFKSLKRSDPDKWKKAVKLLSQETL
jgi:hypothetical protein